MSHFEARCFAIGKMESVPPPPSAPFCLYPTIVVANLVPLVDIE